MKEKVTKKLLVKVAKQLFVTNGLENTRMDDIAQASEMGRRTLYTDFKSKKEIYYEVMESELDSLADRLADIAAQLISPKEKVIEIINTYLDVLRETVMQIGEFDVDNINLIADIWHHLIKGLKVPYVFGCFDQKYTKQYLNKLVNGTLCKQNS